MIGVLFVALFQAAAGPPAPPPAATTAPPAAAEAPATETESAREARLRELRERQKLVCRYEVVLGSRVPTRRCTSKADDEAEGRDSRAWIDRVQSQMPTKGS
jgi:hypothetical protein